jgi:hypothetical protein
LFVFTVGSQDLKKLKTTVENMFLEKTKAEKGEKTKKSKGKGKVKLKVEGEHVSKAFKYVALNLVDVHSQNRRAFTF